MRSGVRVSLAFFAVPFFCCRLATAAEKEASAPEAAVVSSAAVSVPGPDQGRLTFSLFKNSHYSRVGLDYSLRWDFSDLGSFRPGLKTITSGLRVLTSWDITENTRVNYYGFKTNPWRVIIGSSGERHIAAGPVPAAGSGTNPIISGPAQHKRLRLSLSPLVDDLKSNLDENLRSFLLKNAFGGASPEWEKTSAEGKREFMRDVLSLGFWDAPLPALRESKEGLEFIGGKPVR